MFFYFYNTNNNEKVPELIGVKSFMTNVLARHKVLILIISLAVIALFLIVTYLMPKSSKIPTKGVFVLGGTNAENID